MTHSDIKTKFLIEYDKANITSSYPSLTDYEIATLLDKAYYALINQKVTGNNPRQAGFESDNKAIEDIQPLIVTKLIPKVAEHSHVENDVTYNIPSDYLYYVQSKMKVGYNINGQTTYSSTDVELVSHELAKKYMCTTHNKPWVEVPVCYIEDNEITALTDPILHTPGDLDLTYIKQFKKFAFPIDPSEEPDPSTDPEVDPTDDPTIDPTEDIVWSITVDAKTTTFYSKTNTAEVKVVCINNKGELGTYKSYINEDDNDGYITKVSENKFTINSSATDYRNIDIMFVCNQDTSKKTTRTFQFKYYTSSVIPTPTPTPTSNEYVDLGLSVMWGKRNIGATTEYELGGFYGWGDPTGEVKSPYQSQYAINPPDNISGNPTYDIATAKLGEGWRIPTIAEYQELIDNCTFSWDATNSAYKVTSKKNGNYIYMAIGGMKTHDLSATNLEENGFYWTSQYDSDPQHQDAYCLHIVGSNNKTFIHCPVMIHIPVRPVYDAPATPQPTGLQYVDMGLSVLWANKNVGADNEYSYGTYYSDKEIPSGYRLPTIGECIELSLHTTSTADKGYRYKSKLTNNEILIPSSGVYDTYANAYSELNRFTYTWLANIKNYHNVACRYNSSGNDPIIRELTNVKVPIRLVQEKNLPVDNNLGTMFIWGFDDEVAPEGINFSDSSIGKPWQCYNHIVIFPAGPIGASEFYANPNVTVDVRLYDKNTTVVSGHFENIMISDIAKYPANVHNGNSTGLIFVPNEPITENTFRLGKQYSIVIPQGAYKSSTGITPRQVLTDTIV